MNDILVELRAKLIKDKEKLLAHNKKPSNAQSKCDLTDAGDLASKLETQRNEIALYNLNQQHLEQIDLALERLKDEDALYCSSCGDSIAERLKIKPDAQRCVPCQEISESKLQHSQS
ncbi:MULTISPECIES: TraR/DksA family transcriptional regulator [unclassified Agarivorans]|uniref:TraR/DksA family transcriptional regulator n=1 Tax=unclassified Agarivorans TaxID=2636026 RepID=UPI0026E3BB73|nr:MULTISPECIES: TraR/DksA C4-type zinc finger protein [unclassified Agarivorans]MDO6687243.1 TraR/DksA C4-type zinc finger protein [Agarivorans sp. 3_MG-2023]MDO6716830.1 TraR/DksA C4-type zinc finger protein [Agarivorans sp. 2_MG-2023]